MYLGVMKTARLTRCGVRPAVEFDSDFTVGPLGDGNDGSCPVPNIGQDLVAPEIGNFAFLCSEATSSFNREGAMVRPIILNAKGDARFNASADGDPLRLQPRCLHTDVAPINQTSMARKNMLGKID